MLFRDVADYFSKIEAASSRLIMTDYLEELIQKTPAADVKRIVYLLQGRVAPNFEGQEIGFGEKLIAQGIAKATGFTRSEVDTLFKKIGDLGSAAEQMMEKKKQGSLFRENLSVEKVFTNLKKMAYSEGTGSQELKIKLLAELFNSASPLEARYIARIPLGNIRLGIGDPTIMDALAIMIAKENGLIPKEVKSRVKEEKTKKVKGQKAKGEKKSDEEKAKKKEEKLEDEEKRKARQPLREKIEAAYNVFSDLGEIAQMLKDGGLAGLDKVHIAPGTPIRPTAAERLPGAAEIIEKLGTCAVEAKYDGFRVQVSKDGENIKIFSRQSEDITDMFPEIIEAAKVQLTPKKCIVEGEALAFNDATQEYYPFQVTIQRKRKYEVEKKAKEYPLKLFLFDVMLVDGKDTMNLPLHERRKILAGMIKPGNIITLSEQKIISTAKELEEFFEEKISQGLEGVMAKDLDASYIAGARKFAWIKLKRSYKGTLDDTLDLVIIGYYKGKGKRTEFGLGALLVASYNDKKDTLESVAKIGTGMSEEMLSQLEELLSKTTTKKKPLRAECELTPDFWVEPKYVIEVRADEITKSPMHACCKEGGVGLALRFPRMISIRTDKKPETATTSEEVKHMFSIQKRVSLEAADYTKGAAGKEKL